MKKQFSLIMLVAWCNICSAQNLVSNGSFENYANLPTSSGQCTKASGWKSAGGSPDYFHEFASVSSGVNIPYTFVGPIPKAFEGQACAGICSFMKGWTNYREYLTRKLDSNLVAGETYTVSLYCLSNTSPVYYGGLSSDNFGVALSTKKLHKSPDGVVHYTPQCVINSQFYSYSWKKVSFDFYADSAYKYLTIGCFVNDSVQQRQPVDLAILFSCVYTFIDNVSLTKKTNSTVISSGNKTQTEEFNNMNGPVTYTDALGRPVPYQKGLLIERNGNKFRKIYVQ